jgi:hypothetical protein
LETSVWELGKGPDGTTQVAFSTKNLDTGKVSAGVLKVTSTVPELADIYQFHTGCAGRRNGLHREAASQKQAIMNCVCILVEQTAYKTSTPLPLA